MRASSRAHVGRVADTSWHDRRRRPRSPMVCASEDPEHGLQCDRTSSCTVNLLWVRIRDAISGALDSMTLADLVPTRAVLLARAAKAVPAQALTAAPATAMALPTATPGTGALTRS